MPHNPRHGADPGVTIGGGSTSSSSRPSKPSKPQDFFGSMYTSPGSSFTGSGSSEEEDKKIDKILGGGSSGGSGGSDSGSNNQEDSQVTETKEEKEKENFIDILNKNITFGKPIKDLKNNDLKLILEQVKLYQDGMPNYFQGIPGAANFVKGIFNSISQGTERSGEFGGVEGSPTLEGLEDFIRNRDPNSNMLDAFKEADPATYLDVFGLPATDAGLDFFANLSLDDDTVDKLTQQKIIEARERLAQSKESQDRASGIMTAPSAPPVPPLLGPPVVPPAEDEVPENPILNPVMSQRDPFNLAQFYASLPQYTQQGVMSPSLMQYYRNLGLFPRA